MTPQTSDISTDSQQAAHDASTSAQTAQHAAAQAAEHARPTAESAAAAVHALVTKRIPQRFGLDPVRDVQVHTPMHRGASGAIGGVLAIFAVGYFGDDGQASLSLGTLVGFVTLFGITMRNSIMMISHFEHLVNVEKLPWGIETALRGATERLIPILMTAIVTALGLLPLAIGSGEAGREIEGPMAVVILGGLVTSTLLNLLVLPTLALRYGRFVI